MTALPEGLLKCCGTEPETGYYDTKDAKGRHYVECPECYWFECAITEDAAQKAWQKSIRPTQQEPKP